ncbi:hypothetical protein [Chitinophaga barathri]|uniref:Uncharacterized protein n=1 Tax=Chitinophaga barathri TaxID=1647451 RepID=A0A3N4MLV0_9BACT|nr:hypothetical protein [Chitinophaga barathri]RPD42967.1 hypothetical protein EG028_01360 [Chitinophaga barathri]
MNNTTNRLESISVAFRQLDNQFRKKVCKECAWSEATYYRKRKLAGRLSPAEITTMLNITQQLISHLNKTISK